jgi:UDP-N-acetylmuramate: L-alanyl-gamma-D-glutamyl-meso-diaminopimelate ligase
MLETPDGDLPLQVFGHHNLNNMAGAKWICQHMGVDESEFYEAMASFKGASKRLELLGKGGSGLVYKDFAHAPSKVMATTRAVREQYPHHRLVACLELHTYSSLNAEFLQQYRGALEAADVALVFFVAESLSIKGLQPLEPSFIVDSFDREDLQVFTNTQSLQDYFDALSMENTVLLLMSSGNYGGLDLQTFLQRLG